MLIPSLIGIALIGYGAMALICRDADKLFYDKRCVGVLTATKKLKSLNPYEEIPALSHKFRYEAMGKKYERWHEQGMGDENVYIIGRTYRLRYHSENPNEFTVDIKGESKLYYLGAIIGGVLILILTLAGFLSV